MLERLQFTAVALIGNEPACVCFLFALEQCLFSPKLFPSGPDCLRVSPTLHPHRLQPIADCPYRLVHPPGREPLHPELRCEPVGGLLRRRWKVACLIEELADRQAGSTTQVLDVTRKGCSA